MQDKIIIIYYIAINVIAFFVMGIDKKKAIDQKWRVKEKTLFTMAFLGGMIGYYIGMHTFHHKTRKPIFHVVFYVALILHAVLIYYFFM